LTPEKMTLALRVLNAINERQRPIQADVASLQGWVDPSDRSADPDELACIVIMAVLQNRKDARIVSEIAVGARGW
jgi:hypothetical protein